jgi:hypothetical protein
MQSSLGLLHTARPSSGIRPLPISCTMTAVNDVSANVAPATSSALFLR